jgi:hypothetical protein
MRLPANSRLLLIALIFTFVCHGLGMLGMIVFLVKGLPGGGAQGAAERISYIAHQPLLWRLGWSTWQLTAFSDIFLAFAMLQTRWLPRPPVIVTLVLTAIAILPDQIGQALWISRGVSLAQEAERTGNPAIYLSFETTIFPIVSGWAGLLYTFGALGWTWSFASAGAWNRSLTILSSFVWSVFLFASIALFLPAGMRPAPLLIAAANAIGFLLMEVWFLLVIERVWRTSQNQSATGDAPI